ncbi:MAG: transcription factor S [Candidatus Woesearchaeota archaeon]
MIQFCPKCKSILRPQKEGDKVVLHCSCGYTSEGSNAGSLKETVKATAEIEVVEQDFETLPIAKEDCPKCGNNGAYYWLIQTRSADEAMTKFLRCTKCRHTWRDYD